MKQLRDVTCEHCDHRIGRVRKGRLAIKVRSRLMAVTAAGVEVNCPKCKLSTNLPLKYTPDEADPR